MTSRPTLPRWPKWLGRGLLVVLDLAMPLLLIVNAVSYSQYCRAWQVGERLIEGELAGLVEAAKQAGERGRWRAEGDEVPEPFRKLGAYQAAFDKGFGESGHAAHAQHVYRWEDIYGMIEGPGDLPWWCIWPRFFE